MERGLCTCLSGVSEKETAIFTMTKGKIYVCNGKKCKRLDFLTMTKVNFRNFMVKSGQGRCEETSEPFCCPFGQTPRRPRALRDPNFATMSLSRGRVRMTAQLPGNKFPQFARMLTLLARTFGTGEALGLIPDRWYSPRTPKGSRTGETLSIPVPTV